MRCHFRIAAARPFVRYVTSLINSACATFLRAVLKSPRSSVRYCGHAVPLPATGAGCRVSQTRRTVKQTHFATYTGRIIRARASVLRAETSVCLQAVRLARSPVLTTPVLRARSRKSQRRSSPTRNGVPQPIFNC